MRITNRFWSSYVPFQQKYRNTQTHFHRAASKLSLHIRKSNAILPWPNTARPRSNRLIRKWLFALFTLAVSQPSFQRHSTAFYAGKALAKRISRFMSRKTHRLKYAPNLMSGFARWSMNDQRLENRGYFALAFMSVTGNIPHATDHRCIFHGLYLPLDKSARGQVIIHRADLHQNIPCLLLTTAGHAKVHLLWQFYCILMRWAVKFSDSSNNTKVKLVTMDNPSTVFQLGAF